MALAGCLLLFAGCGQDSASAPPASADKAPIRTLGYVVSTCQTEHNSATLRQALLLHRGGREPVTVFEAPTIGPVLGSEQCTPFRERGDGFGAVALGALQRLGVTPDGTGLVFEVTDEFSQLAPNRLPDDAKGIFYVRADGTGLRRLGPPSREACFRAPTPEEGGGLSRLPHFAFSPSGRTIAYTDLGPAENGLDTIQITTLDIVSGTRRVVTNLPFVFSPIATVIPTCCPFFLNERTIIFASVYSAGGIALGTTYFVYRIDVDGSTFAPVPLPIEVPESPVVPLFTITGAERLVGLLTTPSGAPDVFVADGTNVLQLTNFQRADTSTPIINGARDRVFVAASADPLGANPHHGCQIFSIDVLSTDLRQLTRFPGRDAEQGCSGPPDGCWVYFLGPNIASTDRDTGTVVFYSSCDPLGTSPNGGQLYAMRSDGTGLWQVTNTLGWLTGDDAASIQLPGPYAYGPYQ